MLNKKNVFIILIILAAMLLIVSVILVFDRRIEDIETKQYLQQ